MRANVLLLCGLVLLVTGCKKDQPVEAEPTGASAMRLGMADQEVLVPEPAGPTPSGDYERPYASRSWGTDPIGGSMQIDQPRPTPTVQPRPQVVSPAPAPMITPLPVDTPSIHIVRKGDTLWSIAVQHYGNGNRYRDIMAANPGVVAEKLAVGQTLVLP